ncbi:MAG: hypothetical protein A3H31_12940 [Gallionellales bacterium RIFCSPLOWO2_02_FULL_57_47]|nr:MAG: hypothetical protein A3H31_12940 [Gallionellales bacterium RIFCSPLOWO2_02_FULL_57_47]OGT16695.1 MAG: hypothetical protein A3J49_17265 [Gallionellales bacterium RIFCSPHIGHO2_02_FULL_57_16]
MNYSLHPEASQDLDDAAAYYQKQAGNALSQALLANSSVRSSACSGNLTEQLRADSNKGFDKAAKDMIINLDGQLARFREKVKELPNEYGLIK